MNKELKPCPFCGCALDAQWDRPNPKARCRTDGCKGKQLPVLNLDVPEDIAAWNARATTPITYAPTLTKTERSILAYAECCLVDYGGLLEGRRMNEDDIAALRKFQDAGILTFGRIPFHTMETLVRVDRHPTHWITFTDAAWDLAHAVRRLRAQVDSVNRKKVDAALAEREAA